MTAPVFASSFPEPKGSPLRKKRVLLVDTSPSKRDLRAEVIRKLGVDVDGAADIAEARAWWKAALYDLVLINIEKGKAIATALAMTFAARRPAAVGLPGRPTRISCGFAQCG